MSRDNDISMPSSFNVEGDNEKKGTPLSFNNEDNNVPKKEPLSFDKEDNNVPKKEPFFSDTGVNIEQNRATSSSDNEDDDDKENIKIIEDVPSDLENHNSNFVFFFGLPDTGKTVILSALLYYLRIRVGALEPKSGTENTKSAKIFLHDITENIKTGVMPARTSMNQVTRLDLELIPNNKSKKVIPIDLTFLEIAGEDHKNISLKKGYRKEYHKSIDIFLKPYIKLNIVIVTSYDTAKRDDTAIKEFFDELKNRGIKLKSINAILVISKWDKSNTIETNRKSQKKFLQQFIKEKLPMTSTHLDTYGVSKTYFTIGRVCTKKVVVTNEEGNKEEKTVDTIEQLNLAPAKSLSNWLYKSIVGFPFDYRGTLWEQVKFSLSKK